MSTHRSPEASILPSLITGLRKAPSQAAIATLGSTCTHTEQKRQPHYPPQHFQGKLIAKPHLESCHKNGLYTGKRIALPHVETDVYNIDAHEANSLPTQLAL